MRRAAVRLLPRLLQAAEGSGASRIGAIAWAAQGVVPAPPVMAVVGMRHMSGLSEILRKEFEFEKENYQQRTELAAGPPAPFSLTESQGDTLMTLSRDFKGEKVTVEVMVNEQPEEEAFETEQGEVDVDVSCAFTASITKGNETLVFDCRSDGTYLEVVHVSLEPASGEVEDSAYTGPVYEELDEELQQRFVEFLDERGVNEALGEYLLQLVHDKEQREYMHWLERAHAFVRQP